jgi:sugar/nucleoside kinase (ribokinase family)
MPLDVVCLGNALVDVLAYTTEEEVSSLALAKGSMSLVDLATSAQIYGSMRNTVEVSGGSSANTAAGVAALGGAVGYVGKVVPDAFGQVFVHDMSVLGVELAGGMAGTSSPNLRDTSTPAGSSLDEAGSSDTRSSDDGHSDVATGRSLVLVTPDGERTMATHLGVASSLEPDDVDADLIARARIVYVESYLWDSPSAKEAVRAAIAMAHRAEGLVALSASDPFCVERHRRELLDLLHEDVDLLFLNEEEARLLFASPDLEHSIDALEQTGLLAALTRGGAGSVVVSSEGATEVPAEPVQRVVDTTGAGDLYAAGFLFGLTHGHDPVSCAGLASKCAAEVISHLGARPQSDISELTRAPRLRLV